MNTRKAAAFLILATVIVLGCRGARAQGRRASPHEQTPVVTIDGSEMFIEYGRPYTRGRVIFGSLIRWNEVWCPGADEATYLSTSRPIRVNNLKLAASEQAPAVCAGVLEVIGIAAYKNDSPFGVGRHLRDALSARLMVANERIHAIDAGLLLISKEL